MAKVQLQFAADDAGARATAEAVAKALEQAGLAADDVGVKFGKASHASDGLFGSMKNLRTEARQHERVFSYFGGQLASVTGEAKGMATSMVGLGIALATPGMAMVAVVEAIKLVVEGFQELGKESKKAAEEQKKEVDESIKKLREYADELQIIALMRQGMTREQAKESLEIAKLREKEEESAKKLEKAEADLAEARAHTLRDEGGSFGSSSAEIAELVRLRDIAEAYHSVDAAKLSSATTVSTAHDDDHFAEKLKKANEETAKMAEKNAADREEEAKHRAAVARQVEEQVAQLHARGLEGQAKLDAEYEATRVRILTNPDLNNKQRDSLLAAAKDAYGRDLALWREKEAQKQDEQTARVAEENRKSEEAYRQESAVIAALEIAGFDPVMARRFAKVKEEVDREIEEYERGARMRGATEEQVAAGVAAMKAHYAATERQEQVKAWEATTGGKYAQAMTNTFTHSLGQMLTSGQSFKKSMDGLWRGMLTTVVSVSEQMLAKWIMEQLAEQLATKSKGASEVTAAAGVAGANAAASQAGIPIVGPALAAAAMAETSALVLSSMMPMVVAENGARLPSIGGPFPALLHRGETVQTAKQTALLEGLQAQGGQGGGTTHVHNWNIQALDGPSVYRVLRDQMPHVQKALNEASGRRS